MMKDIGLSVEDKRNLHRESSSILDRTPDYPSEMSITLTPEILDKIGLEFSPHVGQKLSIDAVGEIVKVEKKGEDSPPSFKIQITGIDLSAMELTGKLHSEG